METRLVRALQSILRQRRFLFKRGCGEDSLATITESDYELAALELKRSWVIWITHMDFSSSWEYKILSKCRVSCKHTEQRITACVILDAEGEELGGSGNWNPDSWMNWQRNLHFCTHFPDSVDPTTMMEKINYVMEAGGQKRLLPASPEHLPEASLTLGKARSQREICLSLCLWSLVWSMYMSVWLYACVCRPGQQWVLSLFSFFRQDILLSS